jgi:hypothetical protein
MSFSSFVKRSEKEIAPLMKEEIKRCRGLIPEGAEERLQKLYLNYKSHRLTRNIAIISLILSSISILISLIGLYLI